MRLEYDREPIAGEPFSIVADAFRGKVSIEVFIGRKRLGGRECPDPPCHEEVTIPDVPAGTILRVIATDSANERKVLELEVARKDTISIGAGA